MIELYLTGLSQIVWSFQAVWNFRVIRSIEEKLNAIFCHRTYIQIYTEAALPIIYFNMKFSMIYFSVRQ